MIAYETRRWLFILARVRGTVIPRVLVRMAIVVAIGLLVWWERSKGFFDWTIARDGHLMVGAALGLLLVFRTNTSYDRYWEGRKLLEGMVDATRDLARQFAAFFAGSEGGDARERASAYLRAMFVTIRCNLRDEDGMAQLEELLSPEDCARLADSHRRPLEVARMLTSVAVEEADAGRISEQRLRMIDQNITRLLSFWGGAERIQTTPVPFAYAHHIKAFLSVFCFTLPLALVHEMGWAGVPGSAVVAFALFGIDEIGVEIEDPFGHDANDLPVDEIEDILVRDAEETLRK